MAFYHNHHWPNIRTSQINSFYPFSYADLYTGDDVLYTVQFWYKPLSFEERKIVVILGNHGRSPLYLVTLASTGDFEATVIGEVVTTTGGNGALINEWQNMACRKEATRF